MTTTDRLALTRSAYRAYETGDRSILDELLADDYEFFAPPDPGVGWDV